MGGDENKKKNKQKSQFFRANAGAVICNREGLILALERADVPGAWQLPQGGMDKGEEPRATVLREVQEETGITSSAMTCVGTYPELLSYELPVDMRSKKTGRGQVQYWFYFVADDPELTLGNEFRAYEWTTFDKLVEQVIGFRQPLYRKLAKHFAEHIAPVLRT